MDLGMEQVLGVFLAGLAAGALLALIDRQFPTAGVRL